MTILCTYCKRPIEGEYTIAGNANYHTACYNSHVALKCCICHNPINGTYLHDDWGNNACAHHTIKHCDSCNRITPLPAPVNGRYYCPGCTATAANSTAAIPAVYKNILAVFTRYGINAPVGVPVHIVDKPTLTTAAKSINTPHLLGLAVTNTHTSGLFGGKTFTHNIYILGGLPALEFEAVLAHELLHTWLNQYGVKMTDPETEGFCNLGSYLVLTIAATKHAQQLMKKIKEDKSPVYGAGFRHMLTEVQCKGWTLLLTEIKARTG
ncbi:MAG: protein DA1 [Taibaiella sp.]|nr:protein DA1 [Taibaiella sp.]